MTVLNVGYHHLLFPDNVDVAKLMLLLSKGVLCDYKDYGDKKVTVKTGKEDQDRFELSMKIVPRGTPVVSEQDEPIMMDSVIVRGPTACA